MCQVKQDARIPLLISQPFLLDVSSVAEDAFSFIPSVSSIVLCTSVYVKMVFHTFVPDKCLKLSAMKLQATPGAGAYFNEADTFEEDWQEQFWGTDNYNALLSMDTILMYSSIQLNS